MSAEAALISARQPGGGEGFVLRCSRFRQYFVHLDLKTFSEQEQAHPALLHAPKTS